MSKTGILALFGAVLGISSAVVSAYYSNFPVLLLSILTTVIVAISFVTHRYLVKTADNSRRQIREVRKATLAIEKSGKQSKNREVTANQKLDQVLDAISILESSNFTQFSSNERFDGNLRNAEFSDVASKERASRKASAHSGTTESLGTDESVGAAFRLEKFSVPHFYARLVQQDVEKAETFSLVNRSISMRDSFALAATRGALGLNGLQDNLIYLRFADNDREYRNFFRYLDVASLIGLARIVAHQMFSESDCELAELLFFSVLRAKGIHAFEPKDIYLYAEVLAEQGFHAAASQLYIDAKLSKKDRIQVALMRANAVRSKESVGIHWLSVVNDMYHNQGLFGIEVVDGESLAPMDRLRSLGHPIRTIEGPLVSILIPTFEGAERIRTAIDSLVNQTWKNIEVIVIDDGSGEENLRQLRKICADYPEVKLLEQGINQGTYMARNRGLQESRGQFITVHDDDDWSHAQKIELQAQKLVDDPELVADLTKHVRATEDLEFLRINKNPTLAQKNMSSLMFRRSVFEKIGSWDEVNRGGDAEFYDRVRRVLKGKIALAGTLPMSFTRTHTASLTSGELRRGYMEPARRFYHATYLHRQREWVKTGTKPSGSGSIPENMKPGKRNLALGLLDLVVVTDFATDNDTTANAIREACAAADQGLAVGVINMYSAANGGNIMILDSVLDAIESHQLLPLSISDRVEVKSLLIFDPAVLQHSEGLKSQVQPRGLKLIMDKKLDSDHVAGRTFSRETVIKNAKSLFGVAPAICATDVGVLDGLVPVLGWKNSAVEMRPSVAPTFSITQLHVPDFSKKPVIGRYWDKEQVTWSTDQSSVLKVYTTNELYDVSLLGNYADAPEPIQEILGEEHIAISSSAQLSELDFFVQFTNTEAGASIYDRISEALQNNVVVILPRMYEQYFGKAAVYASANDVATVIERLWNTPALYRVQIENGLRFVESQVNSGDVRKRLEAENSGELVASIRVVEG